MNAPEPPAPQEAPAQGPRRFRFNLPLTLIALAMLGLLLSLGTWQTSRYFEKTDRLIWYQKQHHERPPLTELKGLPTDRQARLEDVHMRRVELTGTLEMDKAQLLTSRYVLGKLGYNILAPLQVEGYAYPRIIVNVGWVPVEEIRAWLDKLKSERVTVRGRIQAGDNEVEFEPVGEVEGLATWRRINTIGLSRRIEGLDPDLMILAGEEAVGRKVSLDQLPIDGYPQIERQPPAKNVEYAFTWYGLAGTLVAVYFAFSFRR